MQAANWPHALVAQPFRQPGLDEQARSQRIQLSNVPCDQRPVLLSPTHLQIGRASGANRAASMHCMDSRFGPNGISTCDTNAFGPVLIHLREQPPMGRHHHSRTDGEPRSPNHLNSHFLNSTSIAMGYAHGKGAYGLISVRAIQWCIDHEYIPKG